METKDLLAEIYQALDRAEAVRELDPQDKGPYYALTCPSCKKRSAYLYKTGKPYITCNHRNKCKFSVGLWDYVQGTKKLSNQDTLRELARLASYSLPSQDRFDHEGQQKRRKRETLLETALQFFRSTLWTEKKQNTTLSYLAKRGYSEDEVEEMELGDFPPRGELKVHLVSRGYTVNDIEAACLTNRSFGSTHRLVIPYRDPVGRLKGFVVRAIDKAEPKYLYVKNSRRDSLFGIDQARGQSRLIVVEGFLDASIARVRGLKGVVATGGAVITEAQLENALRFGFKSFVLVLDRDTAGQDGTERSIDRLTKHGGRAYVATLPEGYKDPDELIRDKGIEPFEKLVEDAESGVRWMITRLLSRHSKQSLQTDQGRDAALFETLAYAKRLGDSIDSRDAVDVIARTFDILPEVVLARFQEVSEKEAGQRMDETEHNEANGKREVDESGKEFIRQAEDPPDSTVGDGEGSSPVEEIKLVDTSQFLPMTSADVVAILGQTIKEDVVNKLLTFFAGLSAYTEDSQLNISFNAPASTGKSYIPTEIAALFPPEDVIAVGYCSPTAFFHDHGRFDTDKRGYILDLSRKILIFLDQPHDQLLQRLRPILSHDKKEIQLKITDKSQKAGLRTKNIFVRGYPAVIFCTAALKVDEQESTRFILLSPQTNQEKIKQAICQKILKEADMPEYLRSLDENPLRRMLKDRIRAIKQAHIQDIKLCSSADIEEMFLAMNKPLKPRHQRDIGRLIDLIRVSALLNLWFRNHEGSTVIANDDDVEAGFQLWESISESQDLDLPPFVYQVFRDVIVPAWQEKNRGSLTQAANPTGQSGLTRHDIARKHLQVHGRRIPDWLLRQQVLPMLENAGLITQETDPGDKRKLLIYLTTPSWQGDTNNSERPGGGDTPGDLFTPPSDSRYPIG